MSRISKRNEVYEVTLSFHHETAKAIRCSETGKDSEAFWLPKSQIEWRLHEGGMHCSVDIPAWLAEEKGLSGF